MKTSLGLKQGPKYVIDFLTTHQLIGFDSFWALLPDGCAYLRTAAAAVLEKTLALATGKGCQGCNSARSILYPFHNALWAKLAEAMTADRSVASRVVALISEKRKYRPAAVEVYYEVSDGGTRLFSLTAGEQNG